MASGTEQKNEDAAELYQKAANAFKVGGFFQDAGEAYSKAASIYQNTLKSGMEASKCLTETGELLCGAVLQCCSFDGFVI